MKRRILRTTERLAHTVYYSPLYGHHLPFGERLGELARDWERRRGMRDVPAPRDEWEGQYRGDVWSYMERLEELARYSVIAGCLRFLKPGGSVLDVGCGSGILLRRSCAGQYSRYVGVDISEVAISAARAAAVHDRAGTFVRADAEEFVPADRFDAVVFNETLYYFRSPIELAKRYVGYLKPDGLLVVSTFRGSRRAMAITGALKREFEPAYELTQKHASRTWTCSIFEGRIA